MYQNYCSLVCRAVNIAVPGHTKIAKKERRHDVIEVTTVSTVSATYASYQDDYDEGGSYEQHYSCCPPPLFMITISIAQVKL